MTDTRRKEPSGSVLAEEGIVSEKPIIIVFLNQLPLFFFLSNILLRSNFQETDPFGSRDITSYLYL
jgi:hypothetical protein